MTIADGKAREALEVTWKNGRHKATLSADLSDMSFEIIATREGERDGELHHFKCASPLPSLVHGVRRSCMGCLVSACMAQHAGRLCWPAHV